MNFSVYLKDGAILLIGKLISIALQVYLLKVLTNVMQVNAYGQFALILTFVTFSEILYGAVGQSILRFYFISKNQNQYIKFRKSAIKILISISLLSSIFFVLPYLYGISLINCFILYSFSVFSNISSLIAQLQNGERNRVLSMFHDILDKFLKVIILIIANSLISMTITSVLFVYLISSTLLIIFNLLFFIKFIDSINVKLYNAENSQEFYKEIVNFSMPTLVFLLLSWFSFNSDKWLIEYTHGTTELGYYNSIFQLGFMLVYVGINMLSVLVMPFYLSKIKSKDDLINLHKFIKINSKLSLFMILPILIISFLSYLFSEYFIKFILNNNYLKYSNLFSLLIISGGLFGVGNMMSNNFVLNFRPTKLIFPKLFICCLAIIIGYIMLIKYGIIGIVYGNIISSISYIIIISLMTKNYIESKELVL